MSDHLRARFGTARRPGRPPAHDAPPDVSDAVVEALGTLSKALETVEQARGALYEFHRLSGRADLDLQEALAQLRDAGHAQLADEIDDVLVGRDVVAGRWTFQLVEDYDTNYWSVFRAADEYARSAAGGLPPHVFEARMKAAEQGSLSAE